MHEVGSGTACKNRLPSCTYRLRFFVASVGQTSVMPVRSNSTAVESNPVILLAEAICQGSDCPVVKPGRSLRLKTQGFSAVAVNSRSPSTCSRSQSSPGVPRRDLPIVDRTRSQSRIADECEYSSRIAGRNCCSVGQFHIPCDSPIA